MGSENRVRERVHAEGIRSHRYHKTDNYRGKLIRDHHELPLKKIHENDHTRNRELVLNALQ
jgi:hypothetical protein